MEVNSLRVLLQVVKWRFFESSVAGRQMEVL